MNKELIAERFSKAVGTYPHEANVQQQIAERMVELLKQYLPPRLPGQVVEFGCGTGNYSRLLYQSIRPRRLLLNDLCEEMKGCCTDLLDQGATFLTGDAEHLPFPKETELITSCSTLQWFDNPERFFARCSNYLSRNGYLAFTTFGEENMKEIRRITDNGLPYLSLQELESALAPMYDILHAEEEFRIRAFSSPLQVLSHLKRTGVTGISRQCWTKRKLMYFCEEYIRQFSRGSSVTLTYHPIYIIAKKKEQ